MPHDIIDNRNVKLIDYIGTELPGSQAARFAVGYFFLSGLEAVADKLYNVRDLRLLIGNTSNRETVEQIAEGYRRLEQVSDATEALAHPTRTTRQNAASATAEVIGATAELLDQNADAERLVAELVRLIETGCLKVKVYTRGRLHAKAYIFDYAPLYDAAGRLVPRNDPGIAVVGSSNFTLSGIDMNTELNVAVHGAGNHEELTRWFEALWDEAEDFDAHLMQELRQAWPLAQVTPYETYLKALYEMVADRLDGDTADEFLWRDDITGGVGRVPGARRAPGRPDGPQARRLFCFGRRRSRQVLHRRCHRQALRADRASAFGHHLSCAAEVDVGTL